MPNWEYQSINTHLVAGHELDHHGHEGWELAAVVQPEPGVPMYYYYFKRPISEGEEKGWPVTEEP